MRAGKHIIREGRIPNPGEGYSPAYEKAKELAEGFHGRKSRGDIHVTERFKYFKTTGNVGWLMMMEVCVPDSNDVQVIQFPKERVIVSGTPQRNQLIFTERQGAGIDINIDALEWIVEEEREKPFILIGEVYAIAYFTDKHHLDGPKYQKDGAPYRHVFGMVKNKLTGEDEFMEDYTCPWLWWDKLNGTINYVGGTYSVTDEGIVG